VIEAAEFESVWRKASRSAMWKEQIAFSKATEWRSIAFWLRRSADFKQSEP
jgi:hypothetical protein